MNLDHRKIGYYLTPNGFTEKTKLTLHLISWTIQHYSALKEIIEKILLEMENAGGSRVVFYGVSDEMEIAYITLQGVNLNLVGIIEDQDKIRRKEIFGFELKDVSQIEMMNPDAVLITSLSGRDEKVERLRKFTNFHQVRVWSISNP